jgi:hypothetical protein
MMSILSQTADWPKRRRGGKWLFISGAKSSKRSNKSTCLMICVTVASLSWAAVVEFGGIRAQASTTDPPMQDRKFPSFIFRPPKI